MANKRILKKQIRNVCGDVASECIIASEMIPEADTDALTKIVIKLAYMQQENIANVSFSFDKKPSDFETRSRYNKAKTQYYHKAFNSLKEHFNNQLNEIVNDMNKTLTPEQREINKSAAKA